MWCYIALLTPYLSGSNSGNMDRYTRPNFKNSALITIDVLRDTLDKQPLEIPGTSAVLPKIKQLLDLYRENKKPIVHIIRIYKDDASNVDLCRRELVENGKYEHYSLAF